MSVPHDRDPVGTAQNLTQALKTMSERLDAAVARERRTRRIAWGLVVSVTLDVLLTVILALIAVQAHNASNSASAASMRAAHASASNLALCRASNVSREQQVQLWVHFYDLAAHKGLTPAQKKADKQLIAYIESVFRPRNCAALGRKKS